MFINPMWDSEGQRIGKQMCTPLGYRLHLISDLVGFLALLLLPVTFIYIRYREVVGSVQSSLSWLYAIPFAVALAGNLLYQYSWLLATRRGYRYDRETGESSWLEDGQRRVCNGNAARETEP